MARWNEANPPSGASAVHFQHLLETIVRALVDWPDAVEVTLREGDTEKKVVCSRGKHRAVGHQNNACFSGDYSR